MSTTYDTSNPYYTYYKPSIPAAIAVAILFCAVSLVQIWRIIRTRQWFGIVILVATACMTSVFLTHNKARWPFKLISLRSYSRGRWPARASWFKQTPPEEVTIRNPNHPNPPRTHPIRRFGLHVPRSSDPQIRTSRVIFHPHKLGYSDLRHGRYLLLFCSSRRRRYPTPCRVSIQAQLGQSDNPRWSRATSVLFCYLCLGCRSFPHPIEFPPWREGRSPGRECEY